MANRKSLKENFKQGLQRKKKNGSQGQKQNPVVELKQFC